MENLKVNLRNCYGIKKLEHNFDFSDGKTYSIYASNGTMKTSFAKTFKDLSEGEESKDLMFPGRRTIREIVDENNDPITEDQVFVIEPYNEDFNSEKISTLLVNKELKEKYDKIHSEIDKKKADFLKKLKKYSDFKEDIEEEISGIFSNSEKDFLICLKELEEEIFNGKELGFSDIVYSAIFNDKVLTFLDTKDFKEKITEYINKYNELIESSTYFKKGVFNHNNALTISKNLKDNGFFDARHSVSLNTKKDKHEIFTQEELDEVIKEEKDKILSDPGLKQRFEAIDKAITKNMELRSFRNYLENNPKILPELADLLSFRKKLWISYLKYEKDSYKELLIEYESGKKEIEEIIKRANEEKTDWRNVINIFEKRFFVPFKLEIKNQKDVILKNEVPSITFRFEDSDGDTQVEKSELLKVLSNGEKRALYILNIIFEVEARIRNKDETLFIFDDIADSFDYKNKYAIIEYLKEISEEDIFLSIILTHNFDFFRTIQSRLNLNRDKCFMITKMEKETALIKAEYLNPFSYFKRELGTNKKILIASVPFARNLIEYTKDSNDPNWNKLTSLLHIKSDSDSITLSDLESIFNDVFPNINLSLDDENRKAKDLIFELAENCLTAHENINLENKIVLSIAIRLKAEEFMINKINDSSKVNSITTNQTLELFKIFKEEIGGEESIKILEKVNLMTPENIHLNSFMYEPILDMSDNHLKELYSDVKGL